MFLYTCGKRCDAIRAILDAMFYLNMYYKNDFGDSSEFPEQVNCGKFTALYKILQDYYREWSTKDNPDRYLWLWYSHGLMLRARSIITPSNFTPTTQL